MAEPVKIEILMVDKISGTLDKSQRKVKELRQHISGTNKELEDTDRITGRLSYSIGKLAGAFAIKELVSNVAKVRGEFQQLEVAFGTMLQSSEKAHALMQQLIKTAATTPFGLEDLAQGAKQLLAYGLEAEKVNETLIRLGDIAAGLSVPLNDLVYLYGTTMAQGRLYTQDLNQFTGRGIPMISELAKQFGVAESKVKELVESGKVGFPEVQKVIESLTSEGGKFGGLMKEQSKTIAGQISNIEDAIDVMFNEIGKQQEGIINSSLSVVSSLVEKYEMVGKVLVGLVATYGTYRTAIMLVTAAQGWATATEALHYNWLLLVDKAQKILNATMLANPYVLVATLIAGVVTAMWALHDSTTSEEAAQQSLNDTMEELNKKQKKYNEETEKAIGIAQEDSAATSDRDEAMQLLIARYPEIIKKYIDEEGHLHNILKLKKEIAAFDGLKQRNEKTETLKNKSESAFSLYSELARYRERQLNASNRFTPSELSRIEAIKKAYKLERGLSWYNVPSLEEMRDYYKNVASTSKKQYARNLTENRISDFTSEGGQLENYTDTQLRLLQKKLRDNQINSKKKTSVYIKELGDYLTYSDRENLLTRVDGMMEARGKKKYTPAQQKAELKKELDDAKKALVAFDSTDTKYTTQEAEKQRKKLQDAVDEAEKKYKAFGGNSLSKQQSDTKKQQTEAERRKQTEEKLGQELVELQQENDAAEIETMQEGLVKKLREIDNEYQARMNAISKLESQWKRDNVKAGMKTGDDGLTEEQSAALEESKKQAESKRKKATADAEREARREEIDAMVEYLKEYGSFQQQKLAIEEEYAKKIADVDASSLDASTKAWQKKKLLKEKQQKEASMSFENISRGIDWHALFSGVGDLTKEMMAPMMEQLQAWVKTDEYRNADAETQQKVTELIQEMRKYVGTDQSVTWQSLDKAIKDFTAAVAAYDSAKKKEDAAVKARDEGKKRLDAGEITADEYKALELRAQELGDATAQARENMKSFGNALNRTSEEVANFTSGLTTALNNAKGWVGVEGFGDVARASENIDQLKGTLDSILPNMGEGIAKTLGTTLSSTIGKSLGSLGSDLGGLLSSGIGSVIGIVAQIPKLILNLVGSIKSFVTGILDSFSEFISLRWIDDLVVSILDAVWNLIDTILDLPENLYHVLESIVVDGVGGLLDGVIGRIGNILSFGALDSKVSEWFTNGNGSEVAETTERLTKRNELLEQAIEDLTDEMKTARGASAIESSSRARRLQEETNANYLAIAQAQAGYHNSHHSFDYYWRGYSKEQIARLSEQIGRQWDGSLWSLSPEEMKILRSNVDMWDQILHTGKGNYGGRVAEKLNDYIAQAGKLEEITSALYENLTTTTKDNVFDDFLSSLYDLADGSGEIFDDISENWQKMVNRMVINNLVGAKFQESLESWYEDLAKLNESRTNGEITDEEYRKRLEALKSEYDRYVESAQRDIETLRTEGIIRSTSENGVSQSGKSGALTTMSQDQGTKLEGLFVSGQMHWSSMDDKLKDVSVQIGAAGDTLRKIEEHTGSSASSLEEIKNDIKIMKRDGLKVK